MTRPHRVLCVAAALSASLCIPAAGFAQTTFTVTGESSLRDALNSAQSGDTIRFAADVTLTTGDLPSVSTSVTIEGGGRTLSGNNQFRGLFVGAFSSGASPQPVNVTVQNLTIANTVARGGDGGSGATGGGGGAGLGGALFVAQRAAVTVANVSIVGSSAAGGNGGQVVAPPGDVSEAPPFGSGGGGGLGGSGGAAGGGHDGGGGGLGSGAAGGANSPGGGGILVGGLPGGGAGPHAGGGRAGGGASSGGRTDGGAGGGLQGASPYQGFAGAGGFGGGGGGGAVGGDGGFGGGGGGGQAGQQRGDAGAGGFAGGGGGATAAAASPGGALGGSGGSLSTPGGGGGAGLGGAVFVHTGGNLTLAGHLTINGGRVTAGSGASGAGNGRAFGSGLFLHGSGSLVFEGSAGTVAQVADSIVDERGAIGPSFTRESWRVVKSGAGTLSLTGNNLYGGGTYLFEGRLNIGADENIGSGDLHAVGADATLGLTTGNTFTRTLLLSEAPKVHVAPDVHATWSGLLSDGFGAAAIVNEHAVTGGTLHLTGGGSLTLTNAGNSYSAGTIVDGGSTLAVSSDAALGAAAGPVSLGDGTGAPGESLQTGKLATLDGVQFASGRSFVMNGGGGTFDTRGTSSMTLLGQLSGPGSVTKEGTGTLTLSGTSTYTGATFVNAGTLRTGAKDVLGVSSALSVGAGAVADLDTFDQTVGSLAGSGSLRLGTATLTVGTNGATTSFTGTITGDSSPAVPGGTLVKVGAGTLTLSGVNSYRGGTFVLGGTLVGNTSSLQGSIVNSAQVIFDQGVEGTYAGPMTGIGSLVKTGSGTLILAGANRYSGGTTVLAGVLAGSTTGLQGNIVNNAQVLFDQAVDGTYAGAMSGTGALTKTGPGTLTLTGPNTYTGGTSLLAGVLQAGRTNVFGAGGVVTIAAGATLNLESFDQTMSLSGVGDVELGTATLTLGADNVSTTFAGEIRGRGSVVKRGGGTLTLAGNNRYRGGTTVMDGVLAGTPASIPGDIVNNARVVFDGSGAFAGSMSGRGSFTKTGSGTIALRGSNSYSGGTVVEGGVLVGTTASLQGNILNNAVVAFDGGGVFAGSMRGSGSLVKMGAGTLTLTGSHTYTGGTLVSAGTLAGTTATLRGTIVNNAFLLFDGSGDGSFQGVLGGTGSITKTGSGLLSLSGTHPISGPLTIAEGGVSLDGIFGGSITVDPAAVFRSTGGAVLGGLHVSGRLLGAPLTATAGAPGSGTLPFTAAEPGRDRLASAPVLTVGGNFTAAPGSTLSFPIAPGPNPSIFVEGVGTLRGTHLDLTANDVGRERSVSFLAMTARGGLNVNETSAATQHPSLVPFLKNDGHSLFVTLLNYAAPLGETASTPNAQSVGSALDRFKQDPAGDRRRVLTELMGLDDTALDSALRAVAGEVHSSSLHMAVRDSELFSDIVRNAASERDREADGQPGWGIRRPRWWTEFTAEHGTFRDAGGARGGFVDLGGGAGGFDYNLSDRLLVGAGGGFGAGHMALNGLSASADFRSPRAFAYAGFKPRAFSLRAGGSFARSESKTHRGIAFVARLPLELGGEPLLGGVDRRAESDEVVLLSDQWSEYADNISMRSYRLDYSFGVRRARFGRGGTTESGADSLNLTVPEQVLNLTQSDVRVHLWRRQGTVRPFFETLFRREMSDGRLVTALRFSEVQGAEFDVEGIRVATNAYHARAGVTFVAWLGAWTVEYRYRYAPDQKTQTADLRLRFK